MLQEIDDPEEHLPSEEDIQQQSSSETKEDDPPPPKPAETPMPYKKVFVGSMIWFIDWFNGGALAAFVGYMVLDFGVAKSKAEVGYYSGLISSTYFFTQFLSSFWWGKLSDKWGRRPILLGGLLGALVSTVAFGFSKSFAFAIVSRSINGLLNGNTGVVKTYVGEITDSTNQARAFGYLSLVGGLGMVVGPMAGGYFSQPAQWHPSVFPPGSLFDTYPYLLPCLISAGLNVIVFILAFVYLTETRNVKYSGLAQTYDDNTKTEFSIGEESGDDKIESKEHGAVEMEDMSNKGGQESAILIAETGDSIGNDESEADVRALVYEDENKTALRRWIDVRISKLGILKDPNVLLSVGLYAFYGFSAVTFGEVLPLLALLPTSLGGMGFLPDKTGNLATIAGVAIILFNLLFYHKLANKIGLIKTLQTGSVGLIVLHSAVAEIPRWTLDENNVTNEFIIPNGAFWIAMTITLCLFWSCRQMQLTSLMQLISNSVTPANMGAVNGLAQSLVALTRMFAPTIGSSLLAWSVHVNDYFLLTSRFVFIILSLLSVLMLLATTKLDNALNKPKLWTP